MFPFGKDDHTDHDDNDHGQETTKKTVSDKQETIAAESYRNASPKYWRIESRPPKPCPPNIDGIQTQWRA